MSGVRELRRVEGAPGPSPLGTGEEEPNYRILPQYGHSGLATCAEGTVKSHSFYHAARLYLCSPETRAPEALNCLLTGRPSNAGRLILD
jgi:hypothetical protein